MKKIFTIIIAVLFTTIIVDAQDAWVSHKADRKVTVKFPSAPTEFTPGSFMSVAPDSSAVYILTVVDFAKVANLDSAALAPVKATPEFAAELKTGMKSTLPDVDLTDFTIGSFNGYTSYTASGLDSKKKRYDMFMFIIGTNLYSLSTVINYGVLLEDRDKFFASVTLTP